MGRFGLVQIPTPRAHDAQRRAVGGARGLRREGSARGCRGGQYERRRLARQCRRGAARLEEELGDECRVVARSPFVLGGNLTAAELAALHEETIVPAVKAMRRCYFATEPDQVVTVLVFRDDESYDRYCHQLFGDRDISIYGYYKPAVRTLTMNLATGHGTLLHELTHALLDFDFPEVPAWFNEGLASLHEQCRFRSGDDGPWIEGLVNWRLEGLQRVIHAGRLRPMESLVEEGDFRGALEGSNYAQARYFCMFMQQRGLLEEFYRAFRHDRRQDPRGLASLAKVFAGQTWRQVNDDFQRWVLELTPSR